MKRALTLSCGAVATFTIVASCFDITDPDLSQDCGGGAYFGSFRGRSDGISSDTLMGCAYFMIDPTTGRFSMVLTDGGPTSTTPRVQMVRPTVPRLPVTIGDEPGQMTAALFYGTRRFVVTGTVFTTGPEKQKYNEMSLSGTVSLNGIDSVGAILDIEGTFIGKCLADMGTLTPQDQLKPVVPKECYAPDAGIRAAIR
jgi:hypothetical protein